MRRALRGALALALIVAAPGLAGSPRTDPALQALGARDFYASPGALGAGTAEAEKRLEETAARLTREGKFVKLAVVAGPTGAPSMRTYARKLRRQLTFSGTLVITAPERSVIAIGPRPPADITRDLRSGEVGRIDDPVDRVIRAAELAVQVPPDDGSGSSTKGLTALLALAVIGGAWAAAWGLRRETRRAGYALAATRGRVRVELDALRAHLRALATRPDPPPAARSAMDRAMGSYSTALVQLERSRRPEEVLRAIPDLEDGLSALDEAASALGAPIADDGLYEGLCAVDPGHGPATTTVVPRDGVAPIPACDDCAKEAEAGRPRTRRVVAVEGHDIPFDEAPRARELIPALHPVSDSLM
jgi:hypothetical protein